MIRPCADLNNGLQGYCMLGKSLHSNSDPLVSLRPIFIAFRGILHQAWLLATLYNDFEADATRNVGWNKPHADPFPKAFLPNV